MRRAWLTLAIAATGCGPGAGSSPGEASTARLDDGALASAAYTLPPQAPGRFGFGSDASAERIARWDVDVKPDGEGLPRGRGTVAEGERVFQLYCVACHGPTGTEGPNDQLVGTEPWTDWPGSATVGGYWPYATTLYDYISRAMPQLAPGMLTTDQTYAVVAYILNRNQIIGSDAVMNAETLPAVRMPARDRFVVDDRRGGPEVR